MSINHAKDVLRRAGFRVNVGSKVFSDYAVGTVASSSPSGKAAKGSPITLYPSAGPEPKKKKKRRHRTDVPPPTAPWDGGDDNGNGNGRGHRPH
jgi:beta-lactam-binding protein with PASTA domain